jgi:hypothetical protein
LVFVIVQHSNFKFVSWHLVAMQRALLSSWNNLLFDLLGRFWWGRVTIERRRQLNVPLLLGSFTGRKIFSRRILARRSTRIRFASSAVTNNSGQSIGQAF